MAAAEVHRGAVAGGEGAPCAAHILPSHGRRILRALHPCVKEMLMPVPPRSYDPGTIDLRAEIDALIVSFQ